MSVSTPYARAAVWRIASLFSLKPIRLRRIIRASRKQMGCNIFLFPFALTVLIAEFSYFLLKISSRLNSKRKIIVYWKNNHLSDNNYTTPKMQVKGSYTHFINKRTWRLQTAFWCFCGQYFLFVII